MKQQVAILTCLAVFAAADVARGGGALPQGFGKSLEEWQKSYFTWSLGGDQSNPDGNVFFIPLPDGLPEEADDGTVFFVGHEDVTLIDNEAFMLPVFAFAGETYLQKSKPDDAPVPAEVFTGADVLVTLDGRPLLDSGEDDLSRYYADAVYFDEPILYDRPQNRGSAGQAIGAIWVQGLGFLHGPLEPGGHTLALYVDSGLGFGFINTWDIAVVSDE